MLLRDKCFCLLGLTLISAINLTSGKSSQQRYNEDSTDPIDDVNDSIYYKRTAPEEAPGSARVEMKHPLDPLSALEMRMVSVIVRQYNSDSDWQFKFIGLREPEKAALYPYYLSQTIPPVTLIPRRANVLIADPVARIPIWVIVNLNDFQVESWVESPGETIAVITVEDNDLSSQIALGNPDVQKRIRALGYNDMSDIIADVWDAGYVADNPNYSNARKLVQVYFYGSKGDGTNFYAHPFDFVAYVELGANVVRGIENLPIHQGFDTTDRSGNSVPQAEYNFFPETLPASAINRNLNRLKISQPEGPSFKISGHEVTWDNFKLRIGYNPREGPHLYTVTYNDKGVIRPVAYRLSISEVFLQYGDPRPPLHRKSSFDLGNWEFGSSCFYQPVHQFCRGDAYYFQADHHNEKAETWIVQNSICVVEEDAGILWAYYDDSTASKVAVTRNQRLSISYLVAIGNTNYYISWRFYQDASIELAIKVTGIFSTNLMAIDVKAPPYGNLMAPQVYSEIYQHHFAVRIDADVDGRENTVSTEDIVRVTESLSPSNPYGNGMMAVENVLKTAGEAPTNILSTRVWKISNPHRVQPLSGKPVSWRLIPQGNANADNLLTKDSPIRGRIPWANYNMWVLPYDPDQIFAGGKYLSDGVAVWTQQNASTSIVDTDVVLWHVFNYVDNPSVEDWPVVSGCPGTLGFRLRPYGFLNSNPAASVAPASETTALDGRENDQACAGAGVNVPSPSTIDPNVPNAFGWLKSS